MILYQFGFGGLNIWSLFGIWNLKIWNFTPSIFLRSHMHCGRQIQMYCLRQH